MGTKNLAAGDLSTGLFALAANDLMTVTFADNLDLVEVYSDGAAQVYFTTDGRTPTVGGTNGYPIPAGASSVSIRPTNNAASQGDVVKLISSGTPTVSITRGD